jgi:hypothetical protein
MASKDLVLREQEVAAIMGDIAPEVEDPAEIQRMIVNRIVSAQSIDELFIETGTVATKEVVGIPLMVQDCRLLKGEIEGEEGVYMLIEAVRGDTGELVALNSGAPNIMSILYKGKKLGLLPLQVEVAEAGRARPGYNAPLTLKPIGDTAERIAKARENK